jgi:hypothetical protein
MSRAVSSGGGSASASSSATAITDAVTNTLAAGGSVARELERRAAVQLVPASIF